jgi:RNA polymerase sigma factor (sigma-70 family)
MQDQVTLPTDVYDIAPGVAYAVWRKFKKFVARDELTQEALLWAVRRVADIERVFALEDAEERRRAERRLFWQMARHCEQFARKEKARQSGYHTSDEAYYQLGIIAQLLPFAIASFLSDAPLEVIQDVVADGTPRKPAAPSEGGTLLVMLIDIKTAFPLLEQEDQWLLAARYHHEQTLKQIAEQMECSISTADRRCERALGRLQKLLGGESPWQ